MFFFKEVSTLALLLQICLADYVINTNKFPDDFMFGATTAAYQVEGAWNESGKSAGIWDTITHETPSFIKDSSNADVACDSYHKYKEDVQMLVDISADHYRFSVSWPRILPNGTADYVNEAGITYYKNLLTELIDNDILPIITLYHWDLPQVLQDQGGFLNESFIDWFTDFANVCFENFGDNVTYWVTFNEPNQICAGSYALGKYPPQVVSPGLKEYQCNHILLKAHASVWHLYDDNYRSTQGGKIGMVFDTYAFIPATNTTENITAADTKYQFELGVYANPVYWGDYPEIMKTRVANRSALEGRNSSRLPEFNATEKTWINGTQDFFGLNIYTGALAYAIDEPAITDPPTKLGDVGVSTYQPSNWTNSSAPNFKVVPWTVRYLLKWIKDEYNNPDIFIIENGYASTNSTTEDDNRVSLIREYLSHIRDAMIDDEVNVIGYTVWSLMDNFSWIYGYIRRFGLYEVDFTSDNRTRTARLSAAYFKNVSETKCLVETCDC